MTLPVRRGRHGLLFHGSTSSDAGQEEAASGKGYTKVGGLHSGVFKNR